MEDIEVIKKAISSPETAVIGATCTVQYSGRAESTLASGDRVILIKEDNALIVHQPTGNNPVNYMKPQTSHALEEGKHLILKSSNPAQKEYMTIVLENIHFVYGQKLEDCESIALQGNEKDYADYLYEHPSLIEEGFVPVSREEQTKYGFIDLFGYDKDNILVVIECKRFKAGPDAVTQLRRYVEKMKSSKGIENVRGVLVAPGITKNAETMARDWGFHVKCIDPPSFLKKAKKNQKKLGEF